MTKDARETTAVPEQIRQRIIKLGFECPAPLRADSLQSPILALACMPMYYVAVILEIQEDDEMPESVKNDMFGVHNLRELSAISELVTDLHLEAPDQRQLRSMLTNRRPVDAIIYDYAIETLNLFLDFADPKTAKSLRNVIARTMVSVAHASGKGWFGTGAQATPKQVELINRINDALKLNRSEIAERLLELIAEDDKRKPKA